MHGSAYELGQCAIKTFEIQSIEVIAPSQKAENLNAVFVVAFDDPVADVTRDQVIIKILSISGG